MSANTMPINRSLEDKSYADCGIIGDDDDIADAVYIRVGVAGAAHFRTVFAIRADAVDAGLASTGRCRAAEPMLALRDLFEFTQSGVPGAEEVGRASLFHTYR